MAFSIIIAPAKNMNAKIDTFKSADFPVFLPRVQKLVTHLKSLSYAELQILLKCNDKLTELNYRRYQSMQLKKGTIPALFAYDGIQYKYLAPHVLSASALEYAQKHLRILSGLYGVLKPFDAVVPYRLEMQTKLRVDFCRDLYDFWGDRIFTAAAQNADFILNLASEEYAKAVRPYADGKLPFVTCIFAERENGALSEKGVYVKMIRGEMVRYLAEENITALDGVTKFSSRGYAFAAELSNAERLVFVRERSR